MATAERVVQGFPQAMSNKSIQALAALKLLEFRADPHDLEGLVNACTQVMQSKS